MKYDVIAFDLDGTLINSKPSIVHGLQRLLEKLNLSQADERSLREMIGLPLPDIFTSLKISTEDYELHRSYYSTHMYEHMQANLSAFPGVNDVLENLKKVGYRLALVTSRGRDSLIPCLKIAGVDETLFEILIARDDTKLHKPSPEPLLLALEKLGCEPARLVYVGDAHVDVLCAMAAGCHAVYAAYDTDLKLSSEHNVLAEIATFYDLLPLLSSRA